MANRRSAGRRGQKREDPRQAKNKTDNKLALQATIGCIVLLGFVFAAVSMSKSEEPIESNRKKRSDPASILDIAPPERRPSTLSKVPATLAQEFLIALGNDDQDKIEELIAWETLFARKESESKREEADRYANVDAEAQAKQRERYCLMVMDPDYQTMIRDYALEALLNGSFLIERFNVEPTYGNVYINIKDEQEKDLVVFTIRCELQAGFDPIHDAQNRKAWAITGIEHEARNRVNNLGQQIRPVKKDFMDELIAEEKRAARAERRRNQSSGPPEADPGLIDWLTGTTDSTKSDIERLCGVAMQEDDLRAAASAKNDLIARQKIAIPGLLRAISQLDFEEDRDDIIRAFQLIQVLREITGKQFNFRPDTTAMGFGQGGMTRSTPEERRQAVRRWFGWWEKNKDKWTERTEVEEPESWDDLIDDEDEGGKK